MAPLGDGADSAASPNLVVSFGEMLIDFVPGVAGLSLAESGGFVKAPGGAPANVACAISKLGGSSAFLGKVYYITITSSSLASIVSPRSIGLLCF